MTARNDLLPRFQVVAQTRVVTQIDKSTSFGKRIDDALPTPLNFPRRDIASGNQAQFAIRLHIQ